MKLSRSKLLLKEKEIETNKEEYQGNVEDTLKWYDKQIEKNPTDTGLYYAKSALLAKEGRYEESILILDRIIELDPDNEKVWYIKANTLYELHHYEEAIECFDKILEFAVDDERVWFHKGEALSKLEQYKEAIDCYDEAIQLDRNFMEAWLGRGSAQRKLRMLDFEDDPDLAQEKKKVGLEDALESYNMVTELNPFCEEGWYGYGKVLYALNRYEEAVPSYDRCIEINPKFVQGWYDRGKALQKLDRKEEALQSFETVIGFDEDSIMQDAEAWSAMADSFNELGRYDDALDCFDRILEKYPKNNYALEGKGTMLQKLGRKEEAFQCFQEAVISDSSNVFTLQRVGNRLTNVGDIDTALEFYNGIVQAKPEFEEAWYKIGELLQKQQKHKEAEECFSWILKINPENQKAKRALITLEGYGDFGGKSEILQSAKQKKPVMTNQIDENNTQVKTSKKHTVEIPISPGSRTKISSEGKESEAFYFPNNVEKTDVECRLQEIDLSSLNDDTLAIFNEVRELLDQKEVYKDTATSKNLVSLQDEVNLEKLIIVGKVYLEKKEFGKALSCFDRILVLDPQNLDAWIAKGDVLLEMGKIEGASSCYKMGVISPFNHVKSEGNTEAVTNESVDREWRDTILSFLEDKNVTLDKIGELNFDCPQCGSKVYLNEKLCPGCYTIFQEEDFENDLIDIEDDLVFFERLQRILSSKLPTFIHLDGPNGIIRYLEKRKDDVTGKIDYVFVRGEIAKLSWDYSFNQKDIGDMIEDDKH